MYCPITTRSPLSLQALDNRDLLLPFRWEYTPAGGKINNNRLLGEILVRKGTVASSLSVCLSVSRWIKVGGYTSKPWTTVTHNYRRIIMVVIISYYGSWEAEKSKSRDQTDRLGPEAMCLISTSICRPKCRSPPVSRSQQWSRSHRFGLRLKHSSRRFGMIDGRVYVYTVMDNHTNCDRNYFINRQITAARGRVYVRRSLWRPCAVDAQCDKLAVRRSLWSARQIHQRQSTGNELFRLTHATRQAGHGGSFVWYTERDVSEKHS